MAKPATRKETAKPATRKETAKPATRKEPVRLTYRDGQVVVTPQDQDIFLISAEKATDACRHSVQRDQRISRFNNELIIPLSVWCNQHRDRLSACYLVMPSSSVLPVYMVGASEKYDFELTDMLGELAGKFKDNGWSVHFSQLPRSDDAELAGYFSLKDSLQVYGD